MTTSLQFKEVFDRKDDEDLKALVSRVAARVIVRAEGDIPEPMGNPIALQMIAGYMNFLFQRICQESGITMEFNLEPDPEAVDVMKYTRH